MSLFQKLLGVGQPKPPGPDEVQHDVNESDERMTTVEASLAALKVRLEVLSHREVSR
jgi:hypothetical protein